MRARQAETTSVGVTSPAAMRRACSAAPASSIVSGSGNTAPDAVVDDVSLLGEVGEQAPHSADAEGGALAVGAVAAPQDLADPLELRRAAELPRVPPDQRQRFGCS